MEDLANIVGQEKEIKDWEAWNKSVSRWHYYYLYRTFKRVNQKLLALISDHSRSAGYKVNIKKNINCFPCFVNDKLKGKAMLFRLVPQNDILRYKSNKVYIRSIWKYI